MASPWDDLTSLLDAPDSLSGNTRGTIKGSEGFDATADAAALQEAFSGFGTHEQAVIDIMTHRTSAQRQEISKAFEEANGKSLADALEGETRGDFEDVLVALAVSPGEYEMKLMKDAILGAGTKEEILIEMLASRSNKQIKELSDAYVADVGRTLIYDLKKEVGGDFGKALLILAEGKRDESKNVDAAKAKDDAEALYKAGEKKWGTDEDKFIDILCHRSVPQLRQTLVEYQKLSGRTLQQSVKREMDDELEDLLLAVVKCVKSVPGYMAELLRDSLKGFGSDEERLTRIIVSRAEVDLMDIKVQYKKLFGRCLYNDIESDTSGDYQKVLLGILNSPDDTD